jgi:hypothetical protein
VQNSIVAAFPRAAIRVILVWIPMYPGDSLAEAVKSSQRFADSRVQHFYDSELLAGKTIAQSLGGQGKIAWDAYLFYPRGSEWIETSPTPVFWMHQLTGTTWADATRYRTGDDLSSGLRDAMRQLGFAVHED